MVTDYDEKGKIFTQVVTKRPVQVVLQTSTNIIRGCLHIRPDSRLKDEISLADRFLAVTDVTIYNLAKEELYRSKFLVLNVNHIIWVIPEEEMIQ